MSIIWLINDTKNQVLTELLCAQSGRLSKQILIIIRRLVKWRKLSAPICTFILKYFFVDTVIDMISSVWTEQVGDKPGIEPVGCDYKRLIKRI